MVTLENLPKDMIFNILSRLPFESLFQCKSVSKFWNALINDPQNSSLLQRKHILFQHFSTDEDSGKTQLILSTLTLDTSMSLVDDFYLPLPMDWNESPWPFPFEHDGSPIPFDDDPDYYKDFCIQSHSHGLVCLTKYGRDIILCNPVTREIRRLPHSLIALSDPLRYTFGTMGNAVGCGYDPKSKDFKVVRLACVHPPVQFLRGEIYDLSKDRWREIQVPNIIDVDIDPSFGTCLEGTYYWMSSTSRRPFIHSFDLSEEVFDQIPLPESVEYWTDYEGHMEALNGSVVLFHYPWEQNELNIWKMEKDIKSNEVSWSIICTIDLLGGIEKVLMFVNTDELLITKQGHIVLYNFKTLEFKHFPLKHHFGSGLKATYFVKTLLSLKGAN